MKDLIALCPFAYGGKRLKKNEEFKARAAHAKVLVLIGKAALIAPRALTAAPKSTPADGTYQTRTVAAAPRTRAPAADKAAKQAAGSAQTNGQEGDA